MKSPAEKSSTQNTTQHSRTPELYVATENEDRSKLQSGRRAIRFENGGRELAIITLTGYKTGERSQNDWADLFAAAPETAAERDAFKADAARHFALGVYQQERAERAEKQRDELVEALKLGVVWMRAFLEKDPSAQKKGDEWLKIIDNVESQS